MSKSLNRCELIGYLGGDAELKYTPSGAAVATMSIATNNNWTGKDGTKHEETEWTRLVVWNKLAEVVGEYCKKGNQIYVAGRLKTRSWEDKDKVKRYTTEIVVNELIFLGGGKGAGKSEPPAPTDAEAPSQSQQEETRNDLPF